ncbi:MAG: MFS transporter [Sphingomonadaceae bacterium]|nr:MFS transporter [Sphingomonadaceae bacterium]
MLLWTLLAAYTLNFLDRQILNILAEPIKAELGLSDSLLGFLAGPAFAVFYAVLGVPIARWADKGKNDRVGLISLSLAIWSLMTALTGFAQNFWQMLAARIGVGIGEAGCTPAAHALIADAVPAAKRSSAIAFFGLGVPLGSLLGLVIGGIINDLYGWRIALMLVGVPGLLLALVVRLLLRDPRQYLPSAAQVSGHGETPMGAGLAELFASRTYLYLFIAASLTAFLSYGKGLWTISFFIRSHGLSTSVAGLSLAVALGVAGVLGTWAGGFVADHFGAKRPGLRLILPGIGMLIAAPILFASYTLSDWRLALALLVVPTICNAAYYGPAYAAVQGLVRPQLRALAASMVVFGQNFIGLGLGPLAFGMLSDYLQPVAGSESVRWVLYGAAWTGIFPALFFIAAGRRMAHTQ